ncbi:hypothetical protein QEL93_004003 [Pseudomonas putida]|nr:hypothetical protein [Pseudomonas putida]
MVSPGPYFIFNGTRYGLLAMALMLYIPCVEHPWATVPVTVIYSFLLWERSVCAYTNCSYSRYGVYFLFQSLFLFCLVFWVWALYLDAEVGGQMLNALVLIALLGPTMLVYALVSRWKITPLPYEIRGDRVHVAPRKSTFVSPVLIAMLTLSSGAISPLMDAYPTVTLVVAMSMPAIIIVCCWRTIAGLTHLRAEERRKGVRYTFSNLEEIQAIRARSWAARLFIALNNAIGIRRR